MTTGPDYAADHDAGNRHHPIAVATDYNKGNPASNPNLKYVASEHANQMRGQIINGEDEGYARGYYAQGEDRGAGFELGPDWRADVADEKALRGVTPDPNTRGYYAGPTQVETRGMYAESSVNLNEEYDEYNHEYQQDDEVGYEVGDADGARTPTQTDNFPARNEFDDTLAINARGKSIEYMPAMPANIISAPEPVKGPTANQTQKNTATKSMAPPPKPSANKKVDDGKRPVHNSEFPIPMRTTTPPTNINEAKATSFGDSSPEQTSEDELSLPDPTAATAHKRAFEDSLDYTRDELADKSYSDLDREPFLTDPNGPARSQPAVEQTLEQKLSYMTSMSEEERKAMFEAMTDAENEGTGEWFTKQMKEKMEKLMRAKHNRRMIAAKYEHEVKKRHALVNAKTKDVADELAGLKSGLGNLMPTPKPADKKERREALKTEKKAAKKAGKKGEASK
jgi:Extracellular mutant protein 11